MEAQAIRNQPPYFPPVAHTVTPSLITREGAGQPLSDTDYKTYCYVVLRDLLIAGGFLMGCASFFLIAFNPLFVLGVIPAVAFAILGIKLAPIAGATEYGTRPKAFIPGQPVGLYNQSFVNCWLNSSLQLLFNIPSLANLVKDRKNSYFFDFLQDAQKKYERLQRQDPDDEQPQFWLDKDGFNSQTVREKLYEAIHSDTDLQSGYGEISNRDAIKQEDAMCVFNFFTLAAGVKLPFTAETHNFCRDDNTLLSVVDAEDPTLRYFELHPNGEATFDEAWKGFFSSVSSNGTRQETMGETEQTYAVQKKILSSAPEFFVTHLNRTKAIKPSKEELLVGETRWREGKDTKDYDVPRSITLTAEQCPTDQASYRCRGFATHIGGTNGSGHWVAYVKKDGRYWYLNDQQYPEQLSKAEFEKRMKQGAIFIYEKKSSLDSN